MASFFTKLLSQHPDDDSVKTVFLQADGKATAEEGQDRHVLIYWENGPSSDASVNSVYIQVLQLSGGPGNYAFYPDMLITRPEAEIVRNTYYELGRYTRAQRDELERLAGDVTYVKTSRVNSCRTWTRDLFEVMVAAGFITQEQFELIDVDIPLRRRLPEREV